jgi:muramidase (phage lysozyme)
VATITAAQAGGEGVLRFLDLIAFSEGTSTHRLTKHDGYDVIVTGVAGPEVFTDFSDHPFAGGRPANIIRRVPLLISTAAGRYQLLFRYWRAYQASLGLRDFSPLSQDLVAIQQMRERHAIPMILAGNIQGAVEDCSNIWASFPGNAYGQGGHSMEALLGKFDALMPDSLPATDAV